MSAPPLFQWPPGCGVVIIGHGSPAPAGVTEFQQLVALFQQRYPDIPCAGALLEHAEPNIAQAAQQLLAEHPLRQVILLPALLLTAGHAKNDLPQARRELALSRPDIEFVLAETVGLHPLIVRLCGQRVREALQTGPLPPERLCLMVVGRGTSDPDTNAEVARLARLLQETQGFGQSVVAYTAVTRPDSVTGLERAAATALAGALVFPFLLFSGVLEQQLHRQLAAAQQRFPQFRFLAAATVGVHPHLTDALAERAWQAATGARVSPCELCHYRLPLAPGMTAEPRPAVAHPYAVHPIEAQSFAYINSLRDWSGLPSSQRALLQRLVHASGDPTIVDDLLITDDAIEAGVTALLNGAAIVTDVTMVASGLKRPLLTALGLSTFCGVHDEDTQRLAQEQQLTRSAAGIRRAWRQFGDAVVVAIGDAPSAVAEAVRLVTERHWRPALIIGLPVGFIGTREAKEKLRECRWIPRITNSGFRGGSPWAAAVVNALLIEAVNRLAPRSADAP